MNIILTGKSFLFYSFDREIQSVTYLRIVGPRLNSRARVIRLSDSTEVWAYLQIRHGIQSMSLTFELYKVRTNVSIVSIIPNPERTGGGGIFPLNEIFSCTKNNGEKKNKAEFEYAVDKIFPGSTQALFFIICTLTADFFWYFREHLAYRDYQKMSFLLDEQDLDMTSVSYKKSSLALSGACSSLYVF